MIRAWVERVARNAADVQACATATETATAVAERTLETLVVQGLRERVLQLEEQLAALTAVVNANAEAFNQLRDILIERDEATKAPAKPAKARSRTRKA